MTRGISRSHGEVILLHADRTHVLSKITPLFLFMVDGRIPRLERASTQEEVSSAEV